MSEDLENRSTAEIWDFVKRVRDLGAEYFLPNIAISITQRTLYRVLHGLLQMAVGPEQAPVLFDRLLAYCETKTGAINKELHRFARRIGALPELLAKLESTDAAQFLEQGGFGPYPQMQATFNKFLRDHGHREVEFDPYHPTWIDAPELVVENLKAMLHSSREDPAIKEPLFFKAAAVITECGGPLSHGAVTAREIGLPAVMSVRGVLAALENGEVVTVNGTAGQVLRHGINAPL